MPRRLALVLCAALSLGSTVAAPGSAGAAPTCAPDAFETADAGLGAPIAVGQSVERVICQDPGTGSDIEWFVFDAPGGKAYSAGLVTTPASSPTVVDGLVIAGVFRLGADGSRTAIEAPTAQSYQRFTTPVLAAGRYLFVAANHSEVAGPDFTMVLRTIQGRDGVFGVRLTESLPAPSVASLSVPATVKERANSTGSYTLSGPAPVGGMSLYMQATPGYMSIARVWVPAGASRGSFTMNVGSATKGQRFTITADTRVGSPVTTTTTVK